MYVAMRGSDKIAEGDNLDQVVIAAESLNLEGDIVVWSNNKFIVAEIEYQPNIEEPYTTYRKIG